MNAFARLTELALRQPEQIALQDAQQTLSYQALLKQVLSAEQWLRAQQIKRLAIQLDNSIAFVLWDLAAQLAGVVCVPMPLFFTPSQQQHVLNSAGIDLLLTPVQLDMSNSSASGMRCSLPTESALADGIAAWRFTPAHVAELPEGTSKITFTSGTTGAPKGVCLSASNQWQVAQSLQAVASTLAIHTHLCVLPLAVLLENVAGVYTALMSGARVVLPPLSEVGLRGSSQFDPAALVASIKRFEANSIILLPQVLSSLLDVLAHDKNGNNLRTLRFAAVGGARVAPELLARADALGVPVYEGYGLSECASVVALNAPGARRAGTVGKPLPHVRVVRSDDGELLVHGNAFLGYLGSSATTADEPIATGDLGAFDADGFLHIQGRKKNLLITSFGRNVSPEWPESELLAEPEILQASVFGDGKPALSAVIVPRPGTTVAALDAAVARVNQRLPDYARLQATVISADGFRPDNGLLTSNGRPKRDAIWQRYADALNVRYHERQTPSHAATPAAAISSTC